MYGPFFSERDILSSLPLRGGGAPKGRRGGETHHLFLLPAPDDQLVRGLLPLSRAQAQGGLTPRRLRVSTRSGLALAAAVGVVDGVHGRAADCRTLAQPP